MARSLSLFRNNRNWRGLSHRLDTAQRPVTVDLVPPRWAFWVAIGAGLVWMVVAFNALGELDLSLLTLVGLLFPAVGLVLVVFGLVALGERREVTFDHDGVRVEGRSLAGRESWALAYGDFRGVLHREHVEKRKSGSTTYQIIELLHEDPERTLPLSIEAAGEVPRDRWEGYARALGLPALEQYGDAMFGRAADDLDKSLRTLADEGKIASRFDPDAPPPKGISIAHEEGADQIGGERLRITVDAPRLPLWSLIAFAVPAVFVVIVSLLIAESLVMMAFAALFVVAPALAYRFDRRKPRQILITRTTLALIDPWQGTAAKGRRLKLEEIESVTILSAGKGGRLVIAADRDRLTIGKGLPRPALEWLKDYVTAAIATA